MRGIIFATTFPIPPLRMPPGKQRYNDWFVYIFENALYYNFVCPRIWLPFSNWAIFWLCLHFRNWAIFCLCLHFRNCAIYIETSIIKKTLVRWTSSFFYIVTNFPRLHINCNSELVSSLVILLWFFKDKFNHSIENSNWKFKILKYNVAEHVSHLIQ